MLPAYFACVTATVGVVNQTHCSGRSRRRRRFFRVTTPQFGSKVVVTFVVSANVTPTLVLYGSERYSRILSVP